MKPAPNGKRKSRELFYLEVKRRSHRQPAGVAGTQVDEQEQMLQNVGTNVKYDTRSWTQLQRMGTRLPGAMLTPSTATIVFVTPLDVVEESVADLLSFHCSSTLSKSASKSTSSSPEASLRESG